jgi:hypothetical protein
MNVGWKRLIPLGMAVVLLNVVAGILRAGRAGVPCWHYRSRRRLMTRDDSGNRRLSPDANRSEALRS